MLAFFRKYQKYFFVFITAVIIASFSFFGTFSAVSREEKREDRQVGRAVDGSAIMLSEIQALARFIGADREDGAVQGAVPNLCNDGVVRCDLLRTGLAELLAGAYYESIREDMNARLDKAKRFRPYSHPQYPFLSSQAVWRQFNPAMNEEMAALREEPESSVGVFSRLSRLYQQQSFLTPEALRRVLYFQHQQLGLQIDQGLQYADLSLFGFHSLSDWFGRDFLILAAEFILNAAASAEQKGVKVSLEEAKGDLIANYQESLRKIQPDPLKPFPSFSQHLWTLGFDETGAAEVWRKVLLFRHYFQDVSNAAFVDRLPYKDFASYARETATVALYRWPDPMRLKTMQDLIEFETYMNAVALPSDEPLSLPSVFHPMELIEDDYPELVQASFKAKVREVSLAEAALRAQVKEVWEWELDEKNWDGLKAAFSFLSQGCTREERFHALGKLTPAERASIDAFARSKILGQHSEWRDEALEAAESAETAVSISKASCSLAKVEKPWRLATLLRRAAEGDEEAKTELSSYSDDGKTIYRIEEVEKLSDPRVLTFAEAKSQKLLAKISERSLSAAYAKIRVSNPSKFQTKEGAWKPFSEVKGEVAKSVYSYVFKAIEQLDKTAEWSDGLYAEMRLLPSMRDAYRKLQGQPLDPRWVALEATDSYEDQFKLERTELPIQRTSQEVWMKEKAFAMTPNEWSPIRIPPQGEISFFYLVDKKPSDNLVLDQISFGKEMIAADAQRFLAQKLLETILEKQAIQLPKEVAE